MPINEEASTNFFFSHHPWDFLTTNSLNLRDDKVTLFVRMSGKACGRLEVCLHPSLARALDGSGQFHVPAAVTLSESDPAAPPLSMRQGVAQRRSKCSGGSVLPPPPCRVSNHDFSVVQPVVQALYRLRFPGTEFSWVSPCCSLNFEHIRP